MKKKPDAQKEIDENEEKLNVAKEKLEKLDAPTYSITTEENTRRRWIFSI